MRVAIITGGSKGLGLSLCLQLRERGYRVIEFSRSAPHAFSVMADLSSPEESRRAILRAIEGIESEPIEDIIVINNAGTLAPIGPTSRKEYPALIANMNTNFTSAILFVTEVVRKFQSAPCRKVIANISSGAALNGYAGWALYCAAKAGLENFVRALAVEQKQEAHPFIPVNINPDVIDTEMQALIRASSASDFPDVGRFVRRKEQGELAPPALVAAAILRIVESPALKYGALYDVADYING